MSFGWCDLYSGNRFWVPVSEAALLEAGEAAGLAGGMTLVETSCGNGAVCVFLAEAFHVYARGIEADPELLAKAVALAGRSPARSRVKFFSDDVTAPVDVVWSVRRPDMHRIPGSRIVVGRYRVAGEAAREFPVAFEEPPGHPVWRRDATPLEWERFYEPQERVLRRYRRNLRRGEEVAPIALAADRQIEAFRSQGSQVRYELIVIESDAPHQAETSRHEPSVRKSASESASRR